MDLSPQIIELKAKLQALISKARGQEAGSGNAHKAGSLAPLLKPILNVLGKYSFERENLLGLEISPHYIRICQMKSSYGRWSLNQLASTCMETQFTNMDIQLNADTYAENLKALLIKHNIKTKDVALSIPTSASIIKIINMPDMEEEDLAGAASMGGIWESMVQLNGSIHEYSVYYKLLKRKIKASESLSIKELSSSAPGSLDSLLSGDVSAPTTAETAALDLSNLLGGGGSVVEAAPEATPEPALVEPTPVTSELDLGSILGSNPSPDIAEHPISSEGDILSGNEEGILPISDVIEAAPETHITPMVALEDIPEEEANTMDVLFVAAKKADIALYTSIAEKAGLNPIIVDAKSDALKHAFDTNPDKRKIPYPYALLEFGADENYVYIVEEEGIATYNITLSEEERQLMARHEENEEALIGFVQRYAQQLQIILDEYATARNTNAKILNIYVSSATPLHVEDASSEPLINNFIKQMTEIMRSAQILPCNFCNHIEVPAEFAKKVNAEGNMSAWATVLGLATYKLDIFDYNTDGEAIDRVNLLPGAGALKHTRTTQMLSTLAMAAVFAFVIFISGASYSMLLATSSKISTEIASLSTVKGDFDGKTQELQKLSIVLDKVKSLDSVRTTLPSNQAQILAVYKDITTSIPEGVWLSDVSYVAPEGVEIKGNSINDQNILEFVNKLSETGGFKKVALKTMAVQENKTTDKGAATSGGGGVKKFTLQADLPKAAAIEKHEILTGGVK